MSSFLSLSDKSSKPGSLPQNPSTPVIDKQYYTGGPAGSRRARQPKRGLQQHDFAPGMGAVFSKEATTFRVWAPNAKCVFLTGDFCDWKQDVCELVHEADGYWAAKVENIPDGMFYKYIIHTPDGDVLERNDPCARAINEEKNQSQVVDPNTFDWQEVHFEMPNWNELVIYEMHIGTFNRKKDKPTGTFYTAIEKLDYLVDLGINAIKVLPPSEFPGENSWGYNLTYPYAVEQSYGGPEGLKTLVREAHRKGVAVIIDVVYNHIGPMGSMDTWRFDGWHENDGGGIYFYNDHRNNTPWGQTRPNYSRPEVRRWLVDNALMFLHEYQADGIRVDSVSHIRSIDGTSNLEMELPDGWLFLQELNAAVQEHFPWKITIAEDLQCNAWVTDSRENGGAGFSTQWDCRFVYPIREALTHMSDEARDMEKVVEALSFYYGSEATNRIIYTESHDEVAEGKNRVVVDVDPENPNSYYAVKRAMLGVTLSATAPGIPMIFQGQEFAFDREFRDEHPLDWSPASHAAGVVRMVGDVFKVHRNYGGKTAGLTGNFIEVYHANNEANVIAFHRFAEGGPGDSTVVIANLSAEPLIGYKVGLPLGGQWSTQFNSDSNLYSPHFSNTGLPGLDALEETYDGQNYSGIVDIGPYSVLVLGLDG